MSNAKGPAPKPVFTPEQANMVAYVRFTADNVDTGPIANMIALALAECVAPGMVTTQGRDMADHRRDAMAYMADRLSPANVKRQFQRAAWLWDNMGGMVRAAYDTAPRGEDGTPVYARAVQSVVDTLAGEGIATQYAFDVKAGIAKGKPAPLSRVEKAEKALEKAREAEQQAAETAASQSPPRLAEQIVLTIGRDIFGKAERDAIAAALLEAEAREMARDAAKGAETEEARKAA